jgi:alpha-1,4-digalacturonate transport system permease protein
MARIDTADTGEYRWFGAGLWAFLTRRQGAKRLSTTDIITYAFLVIGSLIMFIPVIWLVMASFKSPTNLAEFPPTFLPYANSTITLPGYDAPLNLVDVTFEDGTKRRMAQTSRPIGIEMPVIDPTTPQMQPIKINTRKNKVEYVRYVNFGLENFQQVGDAVPFFTYLRNSVMVAFLATIVTLIVNSMAAFALSKYRFRGRTVIFLIILSTLMVPLAVIMIPVFFIVNQFGWYHNLIGVIIPPAATPTGVFLLRQYMLTIPDELLEAARIDGAGEWRIYWRIMMPLAAPALAVLAIFSIVWRWNDFLWPLIVLAGKEESLTLQLALNNFQGALDIRWNLVIAMTVLSILPVTLIFAFLQKYITTGIAATGIKG